MLLPRSTGFHKSLFQCQPQNVIDQWHIIATAITVNPFERAKITMYIMEKNPPPGNLEMFIFFAKPVFIKYKYELIDSTHTLIEKMCSSYKASVYVGVFLKLTTGSQYKGSSIVELSK